MAKVAKNVLNNGFGEVLAMRSQYQSEKSNDTCLEPFVCFIICRLYKKSIVEF
jgi:hypothetical protein